MLCLLGSLGTSLDLCMHHTPTDSCQHARLVPHKLGRSTVASKGPPHQDSIATMFSQRLYLWWVCLRMRDKTQSQRHAPAQLADVALGATHAMLSQRARRQEPTSATRREKLLQSKSVAKTGSTLSWITTGMQPCKIASSALGEKPSPAATPAWLFQTQTDSRGKHPSSMDQKSGRALQLCTRRRYIPSPGMFRYLALKLRCC